MYQLHGNLRAKKDKGEELANILIEASQIVGSLKTCKLYIISLDKQENDLIWITEIWDSKEDHYNSLELDQVRVLISKALPLLAEMPNKGQEFEVIGGYGL